MRVIAGLAKGARLAPVPRGTRPLSDRAREGLFSSLGPLVVGARVLDLFAGTGALGIEALSRGASWATLVDSAQAAVRTIRANLDKTGLGASAAVVHADVSRFLRGPQEQVDVALLDPPYASPRALVEETLGMLADGWLAQGGLVGLTRARRNYELVIPVSWRPARRLEYGDSLVFLYREV
jgi:16S rRNA (guanine966-N2)-methyltransferase